MLTTNQTSAGRSIAVLRLSGRFDAHKQPSASHWADRQRQNGVRTLVMDLSDVTFIDAVALTWATQEIGHCQRQATELRIYNPTPTVRIILQLTGLENTFPLWSPEAEAMADLRAVTTVL